MKTLLVTAALAVGLLASPAMSATVHPSAAQLAAFLADTSCHASGHSLTCTNNTDGSYLKQLPDGSMVIVGATASHGPVESACGFEQINPNGMKNKDGSLFCVADYSSWAFKNAIATTVKVPGAKVTQVTCTTSSANVNYTGRTSGIGGVIDALNPNKYDLTTSGPATSDGAC